VRQRVFASAKKRLPLERSQLMEDIIEACECLKVEERSQYVARSSQVYIELVVEAPLIVYPPG
jgi:hypothetical protein